MQKTFILFSVFTLLGCYALQAQKSDFSHISFEKADSIAASYPDADLHNLQGLVTHLTADLPTEVEQFRAIFKWVCLNIANDYPLFLKNQRKRKKYVGQPEKLISWNQQFSPKVYKRLLNKQRTVCTGYAVLIEEMAFLAGIEASVVQGYGRTGFYTAIDKGRPNHSWNAVKLDGKWYLCDATWSAGTIYTDQRGFVFDYSDAYFLTDPALFRLNHYPEEAKWFLTNEKVSFETFKALPTVYKATILNGIIPIKPQHETISLHKTQSLKIKLDVVGEKQPTNSRSLAVTNAVETETFTINDSNPDAAKVELIHAFKQQGNYIIQVLLGTERILGFTVEVGE